MNDGEIPDIHACNLTPCMMATHENYILSQDLGLDPTEETPPKEPPPPQPPDIGTRWKEQRYSKLISEQWDEIIGKTKHPTYTPKNVKVSTSTFAPTLDEIREDIELINTISKKIRIKFQCEGGANTSVTNNLSILHHIIDVPSKLIRGIGEGIICTKRGTYYLQCEYNHIVPVHMYYSA